MEWLFILGLIGWVWWQSRRIGTLERRLIELERARIAESPPAAAPPWVKPAQPPIVETPPPAPAANETEDVLVLDQPIADDELVLDRPLPADDREPLLLDTPLPPVSNDETDAPIAPPRAEPERPHASTQHAPVKQGPRLIDWLAQNGLAWLGGAIIVLVAVYVVTYATQQGWFTPAVRLACALAFGVGLIGVSELARRAGLRQPPGHPLVAALLAGAGAATFYITTWAAHGLYQYIGWEITALLLLVCALILYGLSLLHGQALGVLAVIAAMLAPALASAGVWPAAALTLYVCAAGTAGFALAWFRRWAWVAAATLTAFYFWFAAAIVEEEIRRALALLTFASLGGFMAALRQPLASEAKGPLTWTHAQTLFPAIAISISSVILLAAWVMVVPSPSGLIGGPAWIALFLAALAAIAVRARVAHAATFAVAVGFLVLGFASYLQGRVHFGPLGWDFYPAILFAATAVAVAALAARPTRHARILVSAAGAIGATLLVLLAAASRPDWHHYTAWIPLFTIAALLFACAWRTAQSAQNPHADIAVDFWAAGGAALTLVGVESAFPEISRTVAHAGVALLLAGGLSWQGWRVLGYASLTAAVLSIGHAMSPALIGDVLSNAIPLWGGLLVLAVAASLLVAASRFAKRADARTSSEALTSAAVIIGLVGAYLALRWFAAGGAGATIEPLSETALRAVALMAAGYVLLPRQNDDVGIIAKWRGHVLLGLGLLLTLAGPVMVMNPWWGGSARTEIVGPPLFNTLLIAFAAPAALAFAAAARLYDFQRLPARILAGAGGLLALAWAMLEERRWFTGADMALAPVGLLEGACYALTFLIAALAVAIVGHRRAAKHSDGPFTHDLVRITSGSAWAAIAAAGLLLLLSRHPAWGLHIASVTAAWETGVATLAQAAGVVISLYLARALSRSAQTKHARFAAASLAALLAWSFGHAAIRWIAHGAAMDDLAALRGIEGTAHAIWPLAFVLGGAAITARAPGRETVRAYLYDLQAIWSVAVWPALGYAALGLWALHNPWWGIAPAELHGTLDALAVLAILLAAATLSAAAPRVPHAQQLAWLTPTARVAALAHVFVAATLAVRFAFHGADMQGALEPGAEMWALSAVWAVFGGAVLTWGGARNDSVLRWCGLIILFATAGKVLLVDTSRLSGVFRIGSLFVMAAVVLGAAWLARRQAQKDEPLVLTTPAGAHETPRDPP